jgi:glyoxylase-like metal-dependent hydrolase (beta-lactamase superfamily II)
MTSRTASKTTVHRHQIGEIEVYRIIEMEEPFIPIQEFLHDATPEAIAPHRHWLEPRALEPVTGNMIIPVQSFLIKTPHHTILIDTCIGCRKTQTRRMQWHDRRDETWLHNLHAAGVSEADIDYVFCTHLHLDHTGWNTVLKDGRWQPTFPNARYVVSKEEYAAAEQNNDIIFQENVLPVMEAGQFDLVDMDFALNDLIWLEPTTGHTAGHVAVNFNSQGQRATMSGDLMHSPVQCAEPDWSAWIDADAEKARETRRKFLDRYCEVDHLIMTSHFPSPSIGHIVRGHGAFDFKYLGE